MRPPARLGACRSRPRCRAKMPRRARIGHVDGAPRGVPASAEKCGDLWPERRALSAVVRRSRRVRCSSALSTRAIDRPRDSVKVRADDVTAAGRGVSRGRVLLKAGRRRSVDACARRHDGPKSRARRSLELPSRARPRRARASARWPADLYARSTQVRILCRSLAESLARARDTRVHARSLRSIHSLIPERLRTTRAGMRSFLASDEDPKVR